jgi:hypothetical protein
MHKLHFQVKHFFEILSGKISPEQALDEIEVDDLSDFTK